jgi:G:T-mismatch repair DNA endonuclease (very short patch repair protein)
MAKACRTTEQFICEAKNIRKEDFCYNFVSYVSSNEKINIFCNTCQTHFYPTPSNFLGGSNCPTCSLIKRTNKDIEKFRSAFVSSAIEKYGNKFDYTNIKYVNSGEKVKIICNLCNTPFFRTPSAHLIFGKCLNCERAHKVWGKEEFIIEAIKKHNNLYNYDNVEFISLKKKIEIICNRCDIPFIQSPYNHLLGQGCRKCNNKIAIQSRTKTQEEFLIEAIKLHRDIFDYSLVQYENVEKKIKIICRAKNHLFEQTPHAHLNGHGCLQCENESRCKKFEQFEKDAKLIHMDKYDYPDKIYKNGDFKIKIYCKKCNANFYQTPHSHLLPRGCPICSSKKVSMISKLETEWLNKLGISFSMRNITIKHNSFHNKRINVDAFDLATNTIYFFHGDYWHGNPLKFKPEDINKNSKTSFGELYRKTLEKEQALRNAGYTVISMWEDEWNIKNGKKRNTRKCQKL